MGHGLPVAVGMALGLKKEHDLTMRLMDGEDLGFRDSPATVYCIMSDGEMQEGTTWESAALAAHNKLDNLVVLIDVNKWCAMGKTEDVCNMEPLEDKWEAFGWSAERGDGHNTVWLEGQLRLQDAPGYPRVLICDTIKGKGVSFMENHLLYHYKQIEKDEYERAMKELV